jgi:hypothetical protein
MYKYRPKDAAVSRARMGAEELLINSVLSIILKKNFWLLFYIIVNVNASFVLQ